MKKELVVRYPESGLHGSPCYRSNDSGKDFFTLLDELTPLLLSDGTMVSYDRFTPEQNENGSVCLNGAALESLMEQAEQSQDYCHASRCMMNTGTRRLVVNADGSVCHEAPEIVFRKAVLIALEEE
jgi:hypothetical protein